MTTHGPTPLEERTGGPQGSGDMPLLCEGCGYHLAGLEGGGGGPSAACPECGMAIAESLASARTGSPWQEELGISAWWETHKGTLLHPKTRFRRLRLDEGGWRTLLATTLPVAGVLLVAPWSGTLIGDPARAARGSGMLAQAIAYALVVPFQACIAAGLLFALTYIEWRGIRFFAWQRGWRLTRSGAWQICAHASVGWVVGALVPLLTMAVLWAAPGGRPSLLDRLLSRGGGFGVSGASLGDIVLVILLGGSYVVGLLVFEVLIYHGVRQCRWGNAERGPNADVASGPEGPRGI